MNHVSIVLCDLDGTLADTSHRVHHLMKEPKDWDSWNAGIPEDKPYHHVVTMLRALNMFDYRIIIVTARSEATRPETEHWLKYWRVPYVAMFMRPVGDLRSDHIIKQEAVLHNDIKLHQVAFVLEDRDKVVAMWREMGLNCFQVRKGDY